MNPYASPATPSECPKCHSPMTPEAVVCINCGYHRARGKQLKTKVISQAAIARGVWIAALVGGPILFSCVLLTVAAGIFPQVEWLTLAAAMAVFCVRLVCTIGILFCALVLAVKLIEEDSLLLAVFLFCCCGPGTLFGLLIGWLKAAEYGIYNVMWIWTSCVVINVLFELLQAFFLSRP